MEALALPPATSNGPKPYDAAADAAAMDAVPLQDYTSEWSEASSQPPPPPPPPEPEPEPTGAPSGEAEKQGVDESAREFIELYDIAQSWGFHFYSGKPAEDFALPKFAKDRAAYHLAKGLRSMGSPEVPWWMGIVIALGPAAAFNWMAAREYRRAQQAEAEREEWREAQAAQHGGSVSPHSITRPDGTTVPMDKEPAPAPAPTPRPSASSTGMKQCEICGKPVRKGRKYCSKSCAGKGSSRKNKGKKRKAAAPAIPAAQ